METKKKLKNTWKRNVKKHKSKFNIFYVTDIFWKREYIMRHKPLKEVLETTQI